jgi:hypothetical protein
MQVLVYGTAGDGLERAVQEGCEYVLALGTEEGGDLVYVVAGCRVDAEDVPLEGVVVRSGGCTFSDVRERDATHKSTRGRAYQRRGQQGPLRGGRWLSGNRLWI